MRPIEDFFTTLGKKVEITRGEEVPLAMGEELCLIKKGTLSIRMKGPDIAPGIASYLRIQDIHSGDSLFTLPKEMAISGRDLFLRGEEVTEVWTIPIDALEKHLKAEPSDIGLLEELLNRWAFGMLRHLLSIAPPPQKFDHLLPRDGAEVTVQADETLALKEVTRDQPRLLWLAISQGRLKLCGLENLSVDSKSPPSALCDGIWYQAEQTTSLTILTFEEMVGKRGIRPCLLGLANSLLRSLRMRKVRQEIRFSELAAERQRIDEERFLRSLATVAGVLSKDPTTLLTHRGEDLLFTSCEIVGNRVGMTFQKPARHLTETHDLGDRLSQICRASSIRYRRVKLTHRWWEQESSSLLGFYGDEQKPVALLRIDRGYLMVDPEDRTEIKVDERVAEALGGTAFTFYEGFATPKIEGKQLLHHATKKNKKEIRLLLGTSLFVAILNLFLPFAAKILFDRAVPDADLSLYSQLILGLVIAATGVFSLSLTKSFVTTRLEGILESRFQTTIWDRVLRIAAPFFRKYPSGDLIQRVLLVDRLRRLISSGALNILLSSVFSLLYVVMMFVYSWQLAFIGIGVVLVGAGITAGFIAIRIPLLRAVTAIEAKLNALLMQMVRGIFKLRIAGAERRGFSIWAELFAKNQELSLNAQELGSKINIATLLFSALGNILIFWAIIHFLRQESEGPVGTPLFTAGTFIAFTAAYGPFSSAIYSIVSSIASITEALPLWERTKVVLEAPLETSSDSIQPGTLGGAIDLNGVSFRYDEGTDYTIEKVSLRVKPGDYVAIVGSSGCGKTTLLRLLLGFESPEEGEVRFDNKSLKSLDLEEVRSQMGVVLQGSGPFSGTLYENITCGRRYSPEELVLALERSGFIKDLAQLPLGLDTLILAGAPTLSGGQKQRLLLARALIGSPRLLLLDEATSSLDSVNQKQVNDVLSQLPITRIIVAHRISAVHRVDRIYVLDRGRIVEEGAYEELMEKRGSFARLFSLPQQRGGV